MLHYWKKTFLHALNEHGSVTVACRVAHVSRSTVYYQRAHDDQFAREWQEVMNSEYDRLRSVAYQRAKQGNDALLKYVLEKFNPRFM